MEKVKKLHRNAMMKNCGLASETAPDKPSTKPHAVHETTEKEAGHARLHTHMNVLPEHRTISF